MFLYPSDLYQKLEFDKIQSKLKSYCYGNPAKEYFEDLKPQTENKHIERMLNETEAFKELILLAQQFPLSSYQSIDEELALLAKEDYVLEMESLIRIKDMLGIAHDLLKHKVEDPDQKFVCLSQKTIEVEFKDELLDMFNQIFDVDGEILPNASAELSRISKRLRSKKSELDRAFDSIIKKAKSQSLLSDNVESFRNGRRVLSVPSENKRKIRGIIHDESATGKTAFIEPEEIIDINNDIFDLETERRKEIYRILKALCNELRFHRDDMRIYQSLIVEFDIIQAKANYALELGAFKPKISSSLCLKIEQGFHPLLFIKNKELNKETVKFNLVLDSNRILVLSGPNAGGKSIAMKAVGLIQLMFQSGLLVPAAEGSELSIFNNILADIGDQQSLEDDLSTYSSHLMNMNVFLEQANKDTLFLIDEFGSGTDPKMGGAIAEAILKELNQKKAFGVVTTHYSNLKVFAYKTKGMVNGAMVFDKKALKPSFEMKVGRPGSSFAFEIAKNSGLNKKILQYARFRAGKNFKAIDQLLVDLQNEKKEIEDKMSLLLDKEQNLEKLISNYDQLFKELEFRRKKIKMDQKEISLKQADSKKRELDKYLKELRKEKDLEKIKKKAEAEKERIENIKTESTALKKELFYSDEIDHSKLVVGSYARLRSGESIGKIERIKNEKAELLIGQMKLTIPIIDLVPANEPIEKKSKKSIQLSVDRINIDKYKLDVRGYRLSEMEYAVQEFIDSALINNTSFVEIVHGIGSGALKKAVHKKLKEYKDIKKVWHPEDEHGGERITYVEL